jgi:hypothetical protein
MLNGVLVGCDSGGSGMDDALLTESDASIGSELKSIGGPLADRDSGSSVDRPAEKGGGGRLVPDRITMLNGVLVGWDSGGSVTDTDVTE